MIKRLTLAEIQEAYIQTQLVPKRGSYFPTEGCACALGARFYTCFHLDSYFGNDEDLYLDENKVKSQGYSLDYVLGFGEGFDSPFDKYYPYNAEYILGYEDGRAIGLAILGEPDAE